MRKSDLKKLIKPIVKECIQESLLEDGVLSKVISEVVVGLSPAEVIAEQPKKEITQSFANRKESEALANLKEQRQKMLDAIGKDSMNGVNIFEGTQPLSSTGEIGPGGPKSALSGVDPSDAGIDISDLSGMFGDTWKVIKNG
jgi:flagellin-like hook-associated protein FlgL